MDSTTIRYWKFPVVGGAYSKYVYSGKVGDRVLAATFPHVGQFYPAWVGDCPLWAGETRGVECYQDGSALVAQCRPSPTPSNLAVPTTFSDGSTASYYELPEGSTELQDLISHRDMNAQLGEIFRACYRYGMVQHSPKLRDIKKIIFYAQHELKRLEKLNAAE